MRLAPSRLLTVLCLSIGLTSQLAQGRDSLLSAIPDDALGFAVIHNLSDTSRALSEVAKIVQAPAPDLLGIAKAITGLNKGVDDQGDLAIVLASVEPELAPVILVPVANFEDFLSGLNAKEEPKDGLVEVQIAGSPSLVGRKGSYAVIAQVITREALEKFIASTTNLSTDVALAEWVDSNRASVVVTARGIKQLAPKITNGLRLAQEQVRRVGGENGQAGAAAFDLYAKLFAEAEKEVNQFALGVRIDSSHTIDVVKRANFTTGGTWAKWAADAKPATEDILGGLEAKPFVLAFGGTVPEGAMKEFMKMSLNIMQDTPGYKLTPEQQQKYAELATEMMSGVKSMRMLMGVAEPGAGVYGNTSMLMTVDDSKKFLEAYEKSLKEMHTLAKEINSPAIPAATSQRIKVGETEALEISMDLPQVPQATVPGAPDPQKMMQIFFGPGSKLKYYVAAADEHTVVLSYISPERSEETLKFYKSKKPGLAANAEVAKVAAKLPAGSQLIGYLSIGGMAKMARQMMAVVPDIPAAAIPEIPDSPPFGFAVKLAPSGVEGHLVITADTLRSIGEVVARARAQARERRQQQQQ